MSDDNQPDDIVSAKAGRIPHGTKLRGVYKGEYEFEAEVRDGKVVWDGEAYNSLSAAAVAAIRSTGSNRVTENGWRFWKRKDPDDGEWKPCRVVSQE